MTKQQQMLNEFAARLGVKVEYLDPALVQQAMNPTPESTPAPSEISPVPLIGEFQERHNRRLAQLELNRMAAQLGVDAQFLDPQVLKRA